MICSNTPPLWPTSSVGMRLQCGRQHWTVSVFLPRKLWYCDMRFHRLGHWKWLYFNPHQFCPYISWRPRGRFHKWLHTWVKVRKCKEMHFYRDNSRRYLKFLQIDRILFHLADSSLLGSQDERGFTPLMWAAAFGEKAVVDLLLEKVRKKKDIHSVRTQDTKSTLFFFFYWSSCDLCLRVQTPKQSHGSERVPWHWPALGVMWTLLSLFSDMEWT